MNATISQRLASARSLAAHKRQPVIGQTIGDRLLCAWLVTTGVVWVQTRLTLHSERMRERQDSRLVVRGVAGGYLRTYEFGHGMAWAQRLIRRYTAEITPAGAQNDGAGRPVASLSQAGV